MKHHDLNKINRGVGLPFLSVRNVFIWNPYYEYIMFLDDESQQNINVNEG